MPKPSLISEINGNPVSITFRSDLRSLSDADGCCTKHKGVFRVAVRPEIPPDRKLEAVIHELLHAAMWHQTEEEIETTAADLARILMELGELGKIQL